MNKLLTKLLRMYGNPTSPDPKLMLEELDKSMRGYSDLELVEAMRFILPKSKGFFPDPETIIEACSKARADLRTEKTPETYVADAEWSPKAKADADELIKSDLGRKAADEGWIGYLWDFCRKHRRHPTPHEQMKLIRSAKSFDDLIEQGKLQDGSWSKLGSRFADGAQSRRKKLADIAHGRV